MAEKIAIVGAGVGGLSAASRLASRGFRVEVYEKLPRCGGRNNIIEDRGFKFDTGPSFVLMPDFFAEVFSYCGEDIRDYLTLKQLDVHYKIFYPDGDVLTVHKDPSRTKEELEKFEKGSSVRYDAFLRETGGIYRAVKPLLYTCFTPWSLGNPSLWPLITKLRLNRTYWDLAARYFKSEKLCYAFTFEAMFIGVSPFQTPSFYSVITYADHIQKVSHPMGGMYQIPLALERMARKFNASFTYDTEISGIRKYKDKIILERANGSFEADKVIVNADYSFSQKKLLNRSLRPFKYSCSAFLIYLGLKKKIPCLEHHNLFFSRDVRLNLREIFHDSVFSRDPSFYIHVPTSTDHSLAPAGKEIMYILIPVPNLEDPKEDFLSRESDLRAGVFKKINEICSIRIEDLIETEHRFYPDDFIKRYNIQNGAAFGLSHNLLQSAFFRPANFDAVIPNLYYVGASTQPGGGLPVVIAGSRIVADLVSAR